MYNSIYKIFWKFQVNYKVHQYLTRNGLGGYKGEMWKKLDKNEHKEALEGGDINVYYFDCDCFANMYIC